MKDRHINIEADSKLLKLIHTTINREMKVDRRKMISLLIIKFIFYLSLFAALYFAILSAQNIWSFIAAYVGLGLTSVLLGFNFAHDLSHNTVFKSKALNNLGFTVLYTLVGAHAEAWKHRHIHSHHYAPNVQHYDSDLQITSLIRVEPGSEYKWFHKYQHWYAPIAYTTYSFYWVFIKDTIIYFTDKEYPKKRTMAFHLSFWSQKAVYIICILVIPILFAPQKWYVTVSAFIIMHLLQSLFLLFTFFMTHHVEKTAYYETDAAGYIKTSWVNNQIKSSNDFYPFSQTANFIFGGFNNHIAHHLFPNINHVHYPKLNNILYRILRQHQIEPNSTGFFEGALSHLKHLKNMSIKPCEGKCENCAFKKKASTKPLLHRFIQNDTCSN